MSTQIGQAYPLIVDKSGNPLDNGIVYIGEFGQNPENYPIQIYYDEGFTIPAPQPLRTVNGYFSRNGSPAKIFINVAECSIVVKDKFKILQWSDLNYTGILSGSGMSASDVIDASGLSQQELNSGLESITDLLAIPNPKTGNRVYVKSYHAGTNKGGGNFVYESALSATNDGVIVFNGWVRILKDRFVTPEMSGAKGDGTTNDKDAIQKVVEFVFANRMSINFESTKYATSQTILIPQLFDTSFLRNYKTTVDCQNVEFVMLADVSLFESAYYNAGVLTSSFGTPDMSHNSFNTHLCNFSIGSNVGYLTSPAIKIQDWHQGCKVSNISSSVCQTILHSHNSFYCDFEEINGSYSDVKVGNRFIFSGSHNLNTFRKLVAVNSAIGYKFDGAVTACTFAENSLEGMTIGAQFNATVYDLNVYGDYDENVSDVCFQFNSYVFSTNFGEGYTNFIDNANMCFIEYAPLPGCEINIDSARRFESQLSTNRIIKNKEDNYGYGVKINQANKQGSSISDLLLDSTVYGKNIEWNQRIKFTGFTGNVINNFVAGNYSGRFTSGMGALQGATWANLSSATLQLNTKIVNSQTQKIYVNLAINNGGTTTFIAGEFVGGFSASTFYKYTDTGLVKSTDLNISVVGGFVQINGTLGGTITDVVGEIRLI